MNGKMKKFMAFILSLALVCSSFLEFVVPAKAAQSGFATGAAITSDTALEYCWNNSTVQLSIVALMGTNVTWSIKKADGSVAEGITFEELSDTEADNGVSKNIAVAIDDTATGSYTVTAEAAGDVARTCTLNVVDTMTEIVGQVETDFDNQFTNTDFTIKIVVDKRYADNLVWNSSDEKVTVEPLDTKSDGATYPGSVIKYAKIIMADEKPEGGKATITATTNGKTKERPIVVKKAATMVKDVKVTACDNGEDINVKTHMDDDTIYVDMNETIVLSGIVEGTEITYDEEENTYVIDDEIILSCTENDQNFSRALVSLTRIDDTSYSFEYKITGLKATEGKYKANVLTESGQASKSYNLMVLAPVSQIGICKENNYSIFERTIKNYNVLENEDNYKYLEAKTKMASIDDLENNSTEIANTGITLTEGFKVKLKAIFRGKFDEKKKYVCATTDAVEWTSADRNIVEVSSDGELKAVRSGTTYITCSAKETPTSSREELSIKYAVTVETFKPATKITITKGSDTNAQVVSKDEIAINQSNGENKYNAILQTEDGNKSNDEWTWESSDEKVFTVDQSGYVTPVASGTATLTARAVNSGISANVEIKVLAAAESLTIATDMSGAGVEGHIYTFQAKANAGADESEELTWTSADDKVVFLDPNDSSKTEYKEYVGRECKVLVKATTGIAKVTVKGKYLSSAIATRSFTCAEAVEAESVAVYSGEQDVSSTTISVNKGQNIVLTAKLLGKNKIPSNDDFQWSIIGDDEEKIVKVKSGLYNEGTLTLEPQTKGRISVQLRDLQTNRLTTVEINILIPATDLKLKETDEKMVLAVGDSYVLQTQVIPEDTSDIIKFESSAPDVISVDENGKITGLKYSQETVTITASINDKLKATMQLKTAIPLETVLITDGEGHKLEKNAIVSMINKKDLDIILDCGDSTELFNWTTTNEKVASVRVSEDTYICTVHANSVGTVNLVAESTVTKQKITFRVNVVETAMDVSRATVSLVGQNAIAFSGNEIKPEVKVKYNNIELLKDVEYTVSYENNISMGTGKVIITGIGNYAGTRTVTFKIVARDINSAQVTKINDVSYTGEKVTPAVTMTDLGKTLVKDTDYTVAYTNNANAGTATVTIKGKGNYNGTKTITFNIVPQNISKVKVAKIANQIYTGKAIAPVLKITNGTAGMAVSRDYTVTYSANKKPGKAKAVITGIGNYTGKKTVYFYIAPVKPQLSTVTSTSAKAMKLKWKKDKTATGYEIYYATKQNFAKSSRKVVTISKAKTTTKTIKKLKSNKIYYVKMRSYKKVGSKKIYSDWSNIVNVTVK